MASKPLGVTLSVIGVLLLLFAPIARFFIADKVIAAPVDIERVTTLHGTGVSYLGKDGRPVTGATVEVTSKMTGDPSASSADIAVWNSVNAVKDTGTGAEVQRTEWRMAFDRRTGALTNCCKVAVNGNTQVKQSGQGPVMPVTGLEEKDYERFESATGRSWPLKFEKREDVAGVSAYKFVQEIPATPLGGAQEMPGAMVGAPDQRTVRLTPVYQGTTTMWVDPRSGTVINLKQRISTKLRTDDGVDRMTVLEADLAMDDAQRRDLADTANSAARSVTLLRIVLPLGSAVVGLALVVVGVVILRRARRSAAPTDA